MIPLIGIDGKPLDIGPFAAWAYKARGVAVDALRAGGYSAGSPERNNAPARLWRGGRGGQRIPILVCELSQPQKLHQASVRLYLRN
jgi:hypothetical protein